MLTLRLAPLYLLFLLLAGQWLPSTSYATHTKPCCSCTSCNPMCTCRGTNFHCQPCLGRSADSLEVHPVATNGLLDMRAVRPLDATQRLSHLAKVGDCARRSFALRILGNAAEDLNVESFRIGNNIQTNTGMQFADSTE
jgi:hypothetical protein